jgi:hypothetical protein
VDPSDAPPPPTPYERAGVGSVPPPGGPDVRRRRSRGTALASLLLVVAVVVGGWLELRGGGWADQRAGADERARDAALLALLEDVEASEATMLGFYDRLREEFDPTMGRDEVLAVIGAAAADAVDSLREVRVRIVPLAGDAVVDDVRAAYLPHLDSWVDYLEAVVAEPELELDRERAAPYTLVINATARAFRTATEEMLDTGPSEAVSRLAEDILDAGFRGFDDEAQT